MGVLGVIAEYNPFHNGHLYHLRKAKEVTRCDYVVCIMSGSFIQRGLPALVSKWARTEMALMNHVDLVIELPVYYAVSSAEFFAYGAVKLLDSLGIIDSLCFGSEYGQIEVLNTIAEVLAKEPDFYKQKLNQHLKEGLSFPAARSLAIEGYFENKGKAETPLIKDALNQPNNILGIEYLKALYKLKSLIKPITVKRYKACHNSQIQTGNIASATAVRNMLESNNLEDIKAVVPLSTYEILQREFSKGMGPVFLDSFESALLSMIRKLSPEDLKGIIDIGEGMENRIIKAAYEGGTLHELLFKIKTKRYTLTRVQRILIHILLGLSKKSFNTFNSNGGPQYIRVLGFSDKGKELLTHIKNSYLPLVTSPADFLRSCNPIQKQMLNADILSSDIYCLGYPSPAQRGGGQDFFQKILCL